MKIVALGAGRMGRGIGHVFAYAGYRVDIVNFRPRAREESDKLRAVALAEIGANLALLRDLGVLEEAQRLAILGRIRVLPLVEAPAALAALVAQPARFLNAHFLNPAFLIPLVEVSPAKVTAESTFTSVKALLESAGRVVVRCAPSPGYIVPRLQAAAMNEAARLVEEGVATPEDIDRAVRSGFGPRYTAMGMCEFIDYGGLDILYYASSAMARALNAPRYEPPAIVRTMMQEGRRGAREGEGFHDWRGRDLAAYQRELVGRFVALYSQLKLLPPPGSADRLASTDHQGGSS